jgi:hypothetical protein
MAFLQSILPILIGVSLAAVLLVLGLGVVSMLRGGEFSRKYSNQLMRARIASQGVTVILLVLFFVVSRGS